MPTIPVLLSYISPVAKPFSQFWFCFPSPQHKSLPMSMASAPSFSITGIAANRRSYPAMPRWEKPDDHTHLPSDPAGSPVPPARSAVLSQTQRSSTWAHFSCRAHARPAKQRAPPTYPAVRHHREAP
jgi:hypothetical protein